MDHTSKTDVCGATVTELRDVAASETALTSLPGLAATVEVEWEDDRRTHTLLVSRLEGEDQWITDALFDDTYPVLCNGLGARVTRPRAVAHPGVLAALRDAERNHRRQEAR